MARRGRRAARRRAGCRSRASRESLGRETSEDDTHPAPSERFRLAQRVRSRDETPADGTIRELFADREALTREMSQLVERNLQAA